MLKVLMLTTAGMQLVVRWAIAPFCLGLVGALLVLVVEFFRELVEIGLGFGMMDNGGIIFVVLKLITLALVGNLISIMIEVGLRPLGSAAINQRPKFMDGLDFKGVQLRVLAVIIAILTVGLLEDFTNPAVVDKTNLLWRILILLAILGSGVGLVGMYRLSEGVRDE